MRLNPHQKIAKRFIQQALIIITIFSKVKYLKHAANIITISRIILSASLVFLLNCNLLFIVVYTVSGLSDALDGFIARKTHTQSTLGARLDSIADAVMFAAIIYSIVMLAGTKIYNMSCFIIAVFILRIFNLIFAAFKYHSLVLVHTIGNKLSGLLVFSAPVIFILFQNSVELFGYFVCTFTFLAAAEETLIHVRYNEVDLNRRGLFIK